MSIDLREQIHKLSPIIGVWKGRGVAGFPTIQTSEYFEELEFRYIEPKAVIQFIQKTWYVNGDEKGNPLHWESGFIKALDNGSYQLSNSQDNGRVEVLTGSLSVLSGDAFHLSFQSKLFGNDPRLLKTSRDFYLDGNTLRFVMKMATRMTPEFQQHLESTLIMI